MNPSAGLVTALNKMREMSVDEGSVFHQYFPIVTPDTNIGEWGQPIFGENYQIAQEAFFGLLKRIAYTATVTKLFNNPLSELEGENIPLGYAGEELFVNPVKGRQFDVNDFAGILQKYEADVKTQILTVNMDLQYPVTLTRDKIRTAFTSWRDLEEFITGIINALYNGAYINMFQYTKALVPASFKDGKAPFVVVDPVTDEASGKALAKKLREMYTLFQMPSTEFNAWKKVGGTGKAITTWSAKEDIILLMRADVIASMDVDVLASAFNMNRADFLGKVITVDNFNVYDDNGAMIYDGSKILGLICDKSWFKIKNQDMALDQWFNPNNRSWQYYLNVVKKYSYSLFANGVVICTEAPDVPATAIAVDPTELTVAVGATSTSTATLTPASATDEVTVASSDDTKATATYADGVVTVTGVEAGSATIGVTAGSVSADIAVTVE